MRPNQSDKCIYAALKGLCTYLQLIAAHIYCSFTVGNKRVIVTSANRQITNLSSANLQQLINKNIIQVNPGITQQQASTHKSTSKQSMYTVTYVRTSHRNDDNIYYSIWV